jgi:GNAT superfamily N-acetyltransferase
VELRRLEPDDPRPRFSCGDSELDEFYAVDSVVGGRELLSVTYAFEDGHGDVAAFFCVSNDAIKKRLLPRSSFKRLVRVVPHEKRYSSMPAVKIGRLGVSSEHRGAGVGTAVLDYLKTWFTVGNKTGCRFLVVDAYNQPEAMSFYSRNGFEFLTSSDEREATRIMYFDLITFRA